MVIFFELIINHVVSASFFGEKAFRDSMLVCVNDTDEYEMDIIDIYNTIFRPHKTCIHEPKAKIGLGPFFAVVPSFGYTMASGYLFSINARTAFYTRSDRKKMSTVMVNVDYSLKNQYWTIINSNIYPERLGLNLSGDWRGYKYPTRTYGLGTQNTLSNAQGIDYVYIRIYQKAKKKILPDFYAGIGYMLDYHSDIEIGAKDSTHSSDFEKYGLTSKSVSSGISFDLLFDSRTNLNNPDKGGYFNITYRDNLYFLGSNGNWKSITMDARKYFNFPGTKNVLAFWSYNYVTIKGNPPYLDLPCTGGDDFSNTGRGYVQGRYRGKNLIYLESEYRLSLTRNGLLGGVFFINGESVAEWPSGKFEAIVPGYGLGLRIKFNRRSNTNLAVDYGFGIHGSRGFCFNLGEVF